jgi:glutamate dehydrogenase (NAD(P)+)
MQGFGNVGSHAALLIAERGAKIVAVADQLGGVANPAGLDVPALVDWATQHHTVQGFAGGDEFTNTDIIGWDCDVLIPAALEDAITEDNVGDVRASIIVEGANAPTTPAADEVLHQRGVTVVPDILANAGGVTVSYFEWVQNIQQFRWELERINSELDKIMCKAFAAVSATASQFNVDMRTAAFVLAIQRVGRAALARVHLRNKIQLPPGFLT